ncbi:MAG: hypothetical protein ACOX5F_11285 [Anaerovoracaceae bacterium]|jgi:hypothetical protein
MYEFKSFDSGELGIGDIDTLRDVISVKGAVITSISRGGRNGFVTINYGAVGSNRRARRQTVTLVTGRNTRIRDQFGNNIGIRNLREGMVVDARFSSVMTRSIPPQSNAFSITVVKQNHTSIIAVGRVLRTGYEGRYGFILTGNANNINSQTKYIISNETLIRDRRGNRIPFRAIRPGQVVRIERAPFQTLSIPPQTSALTVQIITAGHQGESKSKTPRPIVVC